MTLPGGAFTGAVTLLTPYVTGTVNVRVTCFPLSLGRLWKMGVKKASTTVVAVAPSMNTEKTVAMNTKFKSIMPD